MKFVCKRLMMNRKHEELLDRLVRELQAVQGVVAIVLGGSWARGTATAASDLDLGLYYWPEQPLDVEYLRDLAARLDDRRQRDLVTGIGEWGPNINGGGWLSVDGQPVDLLYRDLQVVMAAIDDASNGTIRVAYQPGHPQGFTSSIYMAEVALCRVLWDPLGVLDAAKARTLPYPAALKAATIERFFWEADFSLSIARKGIPRLDVSYVAGCCYRAVACLLQTLFALNHCYWMNEKGAAAIAYAFPHTPPRLEARIAEAFTHLAPDENHLATAINGLAELVAETTELLATSR
jgi:predicted nucleotidyltransferase